MLSRVRALEQVDSQFQTAELYGPPDPETGVKSAVNGHAPTNGIGLSGHERAPVAGSDGRAKNGAGAFAATACCARLSSCLSGCMQSQHHVGFACEVFAPLCICATAQVLLHSL